MSYIPLGQYTLKFNGNIISSLQLARFTQIKKLNLLKNYYFDTDTIKMKMPFDYMDTILEGSNQGTTVIKSGLKNNIIEVFYAGVEVYKGYLLDIEEDYAIKFYTLTAAPFLNLLSRSQSIYADSGYINAALRIIQIFQALNAKIGNIYTINPIASGIVGLFAGIDIRCDTNNNKVNDVDYVKKLLELLDIGIYMNNLEINFFPMPMSFSGNAKNISGMMTKKPKLSCITEFFYDEISLSCYDKLNGTNNTFESNTGSTVYSSSISDIFMSAGALAILGARKYNIYSRDFWQTDEIELTNYDNINVGNYFNFENYSFITTFLQEKLNSNVIKGIGIRVK